MSRKHKGKKQKISRKTGPPAASTPKLLKKPERPQDWKLKDPEALERYISFWGGLLVDMQLDAPRQRKEEDLRRFMMGFECRVLAEFALRCKFDPQLPSHKEFEELMQHRCSDEPGRLKASYDFLEVCFRGLREGFYLSLLEFYQKNPEQMGRLRLTLSVGVERLENKTPLPEFSPPYGRLDKVALGVSDDVWRAVGLRMERVEKKIGETARSLFERGTYAHLLQRKTEELVVAEVPTFIK